MKSHSLLVAATGFLLATSAQAQYAVTSINPLGATYSRAWSAYGGKQVGDAGSAPLMTGALWSGTSASAVPLTPPGWSRSAAFGVHSGQQVGMGNGVGTSFRFHALLWTGTASSAIDLNPVGYDVTAAYATDGTMQAGQATSTAGEIHAMAWSGSAASAVDLHPAGYTLSRAYAAWGGQQAGEAELGGNTHAFLWSGTASSGVDLNGSFDASTVNGMNGTFQVGSGFGTSTGSFSHAMRWSGTASSAYDLNPVGFVETTAYGIGGNTIAGFGTGTATANHTHALAWVGTSVIDLHSFLPSNYGSSYAYGVDPITGQVVGEAINNLNRHVAIMWSPVPEPASIAVLGLGLLPFLRRRSK